MRMRGFSTRSAWLLGLALALAAASAAPAGATDDTGVDGAACPEQIYNRPFEPPRVIRPEDGSIHTSLTIRHLSHACIPTWNKTTKQWQWSTMALRTYLAPEHGNQPDDPSLIPSIPGPTFRVQMDRLQNPYGQPGPSNPVVSPGTRFQLNLRNQLPNNSYPYHDCDPSSVEGTDPNTGQPVTVKETAPNCFHGADVTNIHYHGTHVSPQPHHDFVLLELYSKNQTNPPPPPADEYNQVGSYQTDIPTFPWNQAPGTHWYHPHKHGSTGLQVLNGMAGALLIQGPFDDWLYGAYGVDPQNQEQLETFEKVMVVQQVFPELNFFKKENLDDYPPAPLINGLANPVVAMRPGEIQRWRFIGATMQASANIELLFPDGFEVKQIAQDGVQFVEANWIRQPLLPTASGAGYNLAPGNRVDFLVKAPEQARKGRFSVSFQLAGHVDEIVQNPLAERLQLDQAGEQRVRGKRRAASTTAPNSLLTVEIVGDNVTMEMPCPFGDAGSCAKWPETPYYLRDITAEEVQKCETAPRKVAFSMTDPATGLSTQPAAQANGFWINEEKYNPNCANQTMPIGCPVSWEISNDSAPNHPFHIHINPFQLIRDDTDTFSPPYVWMDTIALPSVTCQDQGVSDYLSQQTAETECPKACAQVGSTYQWNGQWRNLPNDPSEKAVCGCCVDGISEKSVAIRQRFEDYTGGYVIHCHILGHEDRGMMHNVQTVCPGGTPDAWKYGLVSPTGAADDCAQTSPVPALPACPPPGSEGSSMSGHGGHGMHGGHGTESKKAPAHKPTP